MAIVTGARDGNLAIQHMFTTQFSATASSTRFSASNGLGSAVFTGSGFTYSTSVVNGQTVYQLTGGTITDVVFTKDGSTQEWSGLSVSAADAFNAVLNQTNFNNLFFGGNDTFNWSSTSTTSPTLFGYGGDDVFNYTNLDPNGQITARIDGGSGNDTLNLSGGVASVYSFDSFSRFDKYTSANTANFWVSGFERINLAAGSNYILFTSLDFANAGTTLTLDASALGPSNNVYLNTNQGFSFVTGDLILLGGAGDDWFEGGTGNNVFNGGGGNNTVDFWWGQQRGGVDGGVTANLGISGLQNFGTRGGTGTFTNIQNLAGTHWNDTLIGDAGDNKLTGNLGDDILDGGAGTDTAVYLDARSQNTVTANPDGTLTVNGSNTGIDTLKNIERLAFSDQTISAITLQPLAIGTAGDDLLFATAGDDDIDGLGGTDTVSYVHAAAGVTVSLATTGVQATGGSGNDRLTNIENLAGSDHDDTLTGNDGDNTLNGYGGTNMLAGAGGNDLLIDYGTSSQIDGGDGDDEIDEYGTGATIDGGSGNNLLYLNRSGISAPLDFTFTPGVPGSLPDGSSYRKIQSLQLVTGAGNDNVTFKAPFGDGGPYDLWTDNGGIDTVTADFSSITDALTARQGATVLNFTTGNPATSYLGVSGVEILHITGGFGNDHLEGGAYNDIFQGGPGDDYLDGGSGFDIASYASAPTGVNVDLSVGVAQNTGGAGTDTLLSFEGLTGSAHDDVLTGNSGDNVLRGGDGNNALDGGGGLDTAAFSLSPGNYYVTSDGAGVFTVQGPGETDALKNIENASFDGTGETLTMAQFVAQSFDPLAYIASNRDLIVAFGTDTKAATEHYIKFGYYEGRTSDFDALRYTASNRDLIVAFGTDTKAATEHYIKFGYYEGRTSDFDALRYTASNRDLIVAFGTDTKAATEHYIEFGYYEGRTSDFDALRYTASNRDLIVAFGTDTKAATEHYIKFGYYEGRTSDFDALRYTASNRDLIVAFGTDTKAATEHYIKFGYYEGRTSDFDALRYTASNRDLIVAFGTDTKAATEHYIKFGYYEGRTSDFDALRYTASNRDLIVAFGTDTKAATEHYIKFGYYEGRTSDFDGVAYLLSNPDLQAAGLDATTATLQYIRSGFGEGRSASGAFGTEQADHSLALGAAKSDTIDIDGDKDWFRIDLNAGQSYTFTLSGTDGGGGTLADPFLEVRQGSGAPLMQDDNSGTGNDSVIHMTAASTGSYYLVASANVAGTGTYNILAAVG